MSVSKVVDQFLNTKKSKKYIALHVFYALESSKIPPMTQTFYIRARKDHLVLEIARNYTSGQYLYENKVQYRNFIPWDFEQVWSFLSIGENKGLLYHPNSHQYLTVENNHFEWKPLGDSFSNSFLEKPKDDDCFQYTKKGYWIHIQSGLKLSYSIYPTQKSFLTDELTVQYDFDIIPTSDVITKLASKNIFWSNTDNIEPL